jgi:16S rRNA (guanine966-N2)-methyltransferase
MRVVAGSARGRQLMAPEGDLTRPTSDRVREAVFNALFSLDDAVADAQVLDLFAGIEALSRGAAAATFVERGRPALTAIERNLAQTGLADRAEVVRADALDWLERADRKYDVVLCDPPYELDEWPRLLDALARIVPDGLVVCESDREVTIAEGWQVVRARRYGGTVVSIVRRHSA